MFHICTDLFFDETILTDLGCSNQQSCDAALTKELHQKLFDQIRWDRQKRINLLL
ncbi:hypothetical protein MOB09_17465 [Bacillus vallismortis]|uniref:hypothetical protein n=1 Tax=Bacillus vallismortis TaxID=72361 RepID=UPI00228310E3|nr:hypothetical protein [Bacillus vallismortis]MCY7894782.1 hypothetical protein [Bacillus vallismortis]